MRSLTWEQVRARRLRAGYLAEPAPAERMVDVVRRVCGLQAQVLTAAELGLGLRVQGITHQDVQAALWDQRTLVKTYGQRGTLHLLPTSEMSLWIAAKRAVMDEGAHAWYADYDLDGEQVEAVLDAMRQALDGRCLTRTEIADAVSERVGSWARDRLASTWVDLLGVGFDAGLIGFGPSRGSQVTFILLDQWIGAVDPVEPEHALRIVCRRFFQAYGPATPRDFAKWFAPRYLTAGEADWEIDHPTVLLLPQYDCYLLGSRFGREMVVPEVARQRVSSYKNGRFEGATGVPVLLIDGVVSGVWERQRRGKRVEIHVQPFVKLTPAQWESLDQAVERIGSFLESPVAITIDLAE